MQLIKSKKGTTLIEVLVASLLLGITIAGLLYSYIPRSRIIDNNQSRVIAQTILQREFENLRFITSRELARKFLYSMKAEGFVVNYTPISEQNPITEIINGKTYTYYYRLFGTEPFQLVSLGADDDSHLIEDIQPDGSTLKKGAQVIEVEINVSWADNLGTKQVMNVRYRGDNVL